MSGPKLHNPERLSAGDDVSRLFPYAMALIGELHASAVIVLAYGSQSGINGCAPALILDMRPTPDAAARNTRMVRDVAGVLRRVADSLEDDMRSKGVPLEARS